MKLNPLRALVAMIVLGTVSADAHHPIAEWYFIDRTQTIEGELVLFQISNPHSYVQVRAPDDKGVMQRWVVEWAASLRLSRQGIITQTLKLGDHLIITGNPGRRLEDHRLRLRTIVRPKDDWKWGGAFE